MHTLIKKISRLLLLGAVFFLPRERKIRIERWHRGREEQRKLRQADMVIVSFGKSGRTWLRVMLSRFFQLRHGLGERQLIGFDNLHRKNAAVPRMLFTHDNYLKDYTGNRESKTDYYAHKVVLLVRHPLDVAVSQYFQWKFRMRPGKKALNSYPAHGTEVPIYDFVTDPAAGLPKIIDFMNLWAAEAGRLRSLHVLRYEDLRADTAAELSRVLVFMGATPQPQEVAAAVEFASVENMRRMESQKTFWLSGSRMVAKDKSNPDSYKVRKAKVGGYRDYFDDDQIATLEQIIDGQLDPLFGYTGLQAGDGNPIPPAATPVSDSQRISA